MLEHPRSSGQGSDPSIPGRVGLGGPPHPPWPPPAWARLFWRRLEIAGAREEPDINRVARRGGAGGGPRQLPRDGLRHACVPPNTAT